MGLFTKAAAIAALGLALGAPLAVRAQTAQPGPGEGVFNARCKACHDPNIDRAPSKATLGTYPAGQIVDALTNGVMKPMAAGLSDEDKANVAAYLTSQGAGAPPAQAAARPAARPTPAAVGIDVKCASNPPI